MEVRTCKGCDIEKPIDAFPLKTFKLRAGDGGIGTWRLWSCRACLAGEARWRYQNKPGVRDQNIKRKRDLRWRNSAKSP